MVNKKSKIFRVCIVPLCGEAVRKSDGFRCMKHRKAKKIPNNEIKLGKLKYILEHKPIKKKE